MDQPQSSLESEKPMDPEQLLRQYFNLYQFRPGQHDVIDRLQTNG